MKLRSYVPRFEPLEDRTLMSTCHVTRLSDSGVGKGFRGDLRYCISKVNTEPGPDVIDFTVTGTINLTGQLPSIASDMDIQGPGPERLTVQRDTGGYYRILTILSGATVHLSGLTIANGYDIDGTGGGIYSQGFVTMDNCVVRDNIEYGDGIAGGGITNLGVMTINNSWIVGNMARDFVESKALGGGIYSYGTLVIKNSTVSDNIAKGDDGSGGAGGGIYMSGGSLVINQSTIARNRALPDIWHGFGGYGGGIWTGDRATWIYNSTIAYNGANIGGGIYGDIQEMRNTILAANQGPPSTKDLYGDIFGSGHNLIGHSNGGTGYVPSDILDVDPMLGALADNGGPTPTIGLLPGSPAIDAGDNTDASEWDQRGPGFPRIVNGTIDIGAFEVQSTAVPSAPDVRRGSPDPAVLLTAVLWSDDDELH